MNPRADARVALGPVTVDATGSAASAEAVFPVDLPVFAGHFPGRPLIPGVASIGLLVAAFEAARGRPARLAAVARCKWKSPGFPGDRLLIRIAWGPTPDAAADAFRLTGTITIRDALACEAVLLLLS